MEHRPLWSLLLFVCAVPCWAGKPVSLLILPFHNATGNSKLNSLQKGIPDIVTASLAGHSDVIHVVEREKLEAIMAEQSLKWENVLKNKGPSALGQMVQAKYVLEGSYVLEEEGSVRFQALIYETETSRFLHNVMWTGNPHRLNEMGDYMADHLAAFFKNQDVREKGSVKDQLPVDPDPVMNLCLMRGMSYYQQNQFSKAIPEFMKVLESRPKQADAKFWLIKSYHGAGMKDHAALETKEFLSLFPNDPRIQELAPHP